MRFELDTDSLLFSQTVIPDTFFTEYLPQLSGDAVKVYLYLQFLNKYNKDIKLNDLAQKLCIDLRTLNESIKSLEEIGLFIRKTNGYQMTHIQKDQLNKLYKPRIALPTSKIKEVAESKKRTSVMETINNEFFQGVMPLTYYTDIALWFEQYNFDEEVMIALFRYCYNKSALHKNYISVVAKAWNKNGIKTFNDLDEYYQKEEKVKSVSNFITKKLRLHRNLSEFEEAYVTKWLLNYHYDQDIIEIALKKTVSKTNPSLQYVDALITDWHEKDLHSVKQIENYLNSQDSQKKYNKSTGKSSSKKSKSNFDEREYKDLDKFFKN